jgi:hypothetical protein
MPMRAGRALHPPAAGAEASTTMAGATVGEAGRRGQADGSATGAPPTEDVTMPLSPPEMLCPMFGLAG